MAARETDAKLEAALAWARLKMLDAEKVELSGRFGGLIRASVRTRTAFARNQLRRLTGRPRKQADDKLLRDARTVDAFLSDIEWFKVGAPPPEGRFDRVLAHLANSAISLVDLPIFDVNLYGAQSPDVVAASVSPIVHYIEWGRSEGRNLHPLIDAAFYRNRYPDSEALGMSPIEHYVKFGAEKGYNPHLLFDTKWYIKRYPDILKSKFNPLAHYIRFPLTQPHPLFDSHYYASTYPDVVESASTH